MAIARLMARQALHAYGGDAAFVLGSILGIHRGLPSLPADWPLLEPPDGGGLAELLADPAGALRDLVRRLATELSSAGMPFGPEALRILGALLRSWETPGGTRPDVDVTVSGDGTPEHPWAVPLPVDAIAGPGAALDPELLAWLEPAGPPGDWLAVLAAQADSIVDGDGLADFLARVAVFHSGLDDQLSGRGLASLGVAIGRAGDLAARRRRRRAVGVAAAGRRDVDPRLRRRCTRTSSSRRTHRSSTKSQRTVRLGASERARPVVLVAPPFADHTQWGDLLTAIDPAHPAGTHFDLRSVPNPADVDLSAVTTVAAAYSADLLTGAAQSELIQLERVVRRVIALTGAPGVILVGPLRGRPHRENPRGATPGAHLPARDAGHARTAARR